jgi:hypothetical protein
MGFAIPTSQNDQCLIQQITVNTFISFSKLLHSHNEDCTHSNNWRTVKHNDTGDIVFFRAFVIIF